MNTIKKQILKLSRNMVRKTYIEQNWLDDSEDSILDVTVSYVGSWQKRGHTSLYDIDAVFDVVTELVLDFDILSRYCPKCASVLKDLGGTSAEFAIWKEAHKFYCQNFLRFNHAARRWVLHWIFGNNQSKIIKCAKQQC